MTIFTPVAPGPQVALDERLELGQVARPVEALHRGADRRGSKSRSCASKKSTASTRAAAV